MGSQVPIGGDFCWQTSVGERQGRTRNSGHTESSDPDRRPPVPRELLPEALLTMRPWNLFELDADRFMSNIRVARRGAAPGPSGLTAEHLLPVLDAAVGALFRVADLLANGFIPPEAHAAIRLGRITALEKPSRGTHGIVVGDFFRRIVARTVAQQVSEDVEKATKPFQSEQSTRAGCECVSHVLQTLLEMDENSTLLSVDGVGASCSTCPTGTNFFLSFASSTVPHPLSCGRTRWGRSTSSQGEGGEQGDPLMPLLFCLGQHRGLCAVVERLGPREHLVAFLDDVYVVTVQEQLWTHTTSWERKCGGTPRSHFTSGRQ